MIELTPELALEIELAEAAGGADCALFLAQRDPAAGAVRKIGSGVAIFAGVDSPITQAFGLGLAGPVEVADFEKLEEFFQVRGAAVNVETCPLADLSLTDGFCSRGYRPVEYSNVHAREMDLPLGLPDPSPEVRVRPIRKGEEVLWAEAAARGFGEGEADEALTAVIRDFASPDNVLCHLALVDGQPAGAASMRVQERIAVVNGAATLPQFRRRGVHTALLRVRLEKARQAGCQLAMVATRVGSGAQRNVERAGFRVLYTRTKWCLGGES